MQIEYGISTVPERSLNLFPRTMGSLRNAGFDNPVIFVDDPLDCKYRDWMTNSHEISTRSRRLGVYGNWMLGMMELYLRNPFADCYIMFEDDILASSNLKEYISCTELRENVYYNLYNVSDNEKKEVGWYESGQDGKGALGLVFPNNTFRILFTTLEFYMRLRSPREKARRNLDGGIITSLKRKGIKEYIHYPSLVQHNGKDQSTLGTKQREISKCFRGEGFDCMDLVIGEESCF